MSTRGARRIAGGLVGAAFAAMLAVTLWVSEPREAPANTGDIPPDVSIVFVIDSSPSMFPPIGDDYFGFAKDGIVEFLNLPGFPRDGSYEISVIQYAAIGSPGYERGESGAAGPVHWFGPMEVNDAVVPPTSTAAGKEAVEELVKYLRPSKHFTASLMEIGIREAAELLKNASAGDDQTQKHIVLIGTGEYRLPDPCPPDCWGSPEGNACNWGGVNCDSTDSAFGCQAPYNCNRACHVRYWLDEATTAGLRVSAVHVGPEWHNDHSRCSTWPVEGDDPYQLGIYDENIHDSPFCTEQPAQPDRAGFLQEIASADDCGTPTATVPAHGYVRIHPEVNFGCAVTPEGCPPVGTERDVAGAIAQWLCDWDAGPNSDDDYADPPDNMKPILDICDNCPAHPNPHQRDCNADGTGDKCQTFYTGLCDTAPGDDDDDGLCDALDMCPDGDDCLVQYWHTQAQCTESSDTSSCQCDCDQDGYTDLCSAAREYEDNFPHSSPESRDTNYNGIPDCTEGNDPICRPVPSSCDLGLTSEYHEDFSDYTPVDANGDLQEAVDWLSMRGWRLSHPEAAQRVSISTDASGLAYLNLSSETLQIDNDPSPWYIETPGWVPPPITRCQRARGTSNMCAEEDCPSLGKWSYLAIEFDVWINNISGEVWQLDVLDACYATTDVARARVQMIGGESVGDSGWFYLQDAEDETESFLNASISYPQSDNEFLGGWLTFIVYIDHTYPYMIASNGSGECWWPGTANNRIKVKSKYGGGAKASEWFAELGQVSWFERKGLRLRIIADTVGSNDPFKIRRIRVRPANGCETSGRVACSEGEPYCVCFGTSWGCTAMPADGTLWPECAGASEPGCYNVCGDGAVCPFTEQCDDGNTVSMDGCDAHCVFEESTAATSGCGDGLVEEPEECDDGNFDAGDGCNPDCLTEPVCGDGFSTDSEECDDGNLVPGDGCNSACLIEPVCGDGTITDDEECDDGNTLSGDGCDGGCLLEPVCGDGIVEAPEQCDDGNTSPGDGCDGNCQIECTCGDGAICGSEECDDGSANSDTQADACRTNCELPSCGDGVVDSGEICDDGNNTSGDGCSPSCGLEGPGGGGGFSKTKAEEGRGRGPEKPRGPRK